MGWGQDFKMEKRHLDVPKAMTSFIFLTVVEIHGTNWQNLHLHNLFFGKGATSIQLHAASYFFVVFHL